MALEELIEKVRDVERVWVRYKPMEAENQG